MKAQYVPPASRSVLLLIRAHHSGVNSLIFEIRFPATFPHEPPFFRIIRPRFLPFIQVRSYPHKLTHSDCVRQGGGGHVTGGGSVSPAAPPSRA
jgi:hypothetical protein